MEQIKPNYVGGANFEARTVKTNRLPAPAFGLKPPLQKPPVIDQCGELLGVLSKNKMNRNVGGFGHDPKTEPVEAHIKKTQCLLLRRPDDCGGGANDAQRKGRRSSCRNPRKIAGRNDKY
jgi:hypothetical protein